MEEQQVAQKQEETRGFPNTFGGREQMFAGKFFAQSLRPYKMMDDIDERSCFVVVDCISGWSTYGGQCCINEATLTELQTASRSGCSICIKICALGVMRSQKMSVTGY